MFTIDVKSVEGIDDYAFALRVIFMVVNANFNNISVISCRFYWWKKPEYKEKTTDLGIDDYAFALRVMVFNQ
jgi:hypothetical protein